jgi:hypothetical protein
MFTFQCDNFRLSKFEEDEVARHVARMREKGNALRLLVEKPEGRRPL